MIHIAALATDYFSDYQDKRESNEAAGDNSQVFGECSFYLMAKQQPHDRDWQSACDD